MGAVTWTTTKCRDDDPISSLENALELHGCTHAVAPNVDVQSDGAAAVAVVRGEQEATAASASSELSPALVSEPLEPRVVTESDAREAGMVAAEEVASVSSLAAESSAFEEFVTQISAGSNCTGSRVAQGETEQK